MIAVLLASRAFAQDPPTPDPPPAEPPPIEEPPPPAEPLPEPVPVVPEPVPDPEPQPTPWVEDPGPRKRTSSFTRYGVFLEAGSIANDDPAYDLFSNGNAMGSVGVALAANPSSNLAIVGSWHHFQHGANVSVGSGGSGSSSTFASDADFESDAREFRSAIFSNEGALGLRFSAGFMDLVYPYIAAQGLLMTSRMRLDDVPDENDNPGQVQASGLTGGAMGTAGVEIRLPPDSDVQFAWTLEFGHGWLARAEFGDFGTMQPGGFVARSGVGLRF